MTPNPYRNASSAARSAVQQSQFLVGRVESVDDEKHVARVRFSPEESEWCEIIIDSVGDYTLPPRETQVIVAKRRGSQPVIIGQTYSSDDEVPADAVGSDGERVIGHPASDTKIRFNADGSYEILHDDGSTALTVKENGIVLGEGDGQPVARKGDAVEVTDTNGNTLTGQITEGSSSVKSN